MSRLPPTGTSDEYAALFEEVHPSGADRHVNLDAKITGAKQSYGAAFRLSWCLVLADGWLDWQLTGRDK